MHPSQSPRRVVVQVGMLAALFSAVSMGSLAVSRVPVPSTRQEAPADPLVALNDTSRMLYSLAKQQALASSGPVLIVVGETWYSGMVKGASQARIVPEIYHTLKAVSIFPWLSMCIWPRTRARARCRRTCSKTYAPIASSSPPRPSESRQPVLMRNSKSGRKRFLKEPQGFSDEVLQSRQCTQARRVSFTAR